MSALSQRQHLPDNEETSRIRRELQDTERGLQRRIEEVIHVLCAYRELMCIDGKLFYRTHGVMEHVCRRKAWRQRRKATGVCGVHVICEHVIQVGDGLV